MHAYRISMGHGMETHRLLVRSAFIALLSLAMVLINLFMLGEVWGQAFAATPPEQAGFPPVSGTAVSTGERSGWRFASGLGMLGSTPDDTALAWNTEAEVALQEGVSVGPLLQLGFTDDLTQVGLSGQLKYWLLPPQAGTRTGVNLQAGVGFIHANAGGSDTSWLVPLGIGVEEPLTPTTNLHSTFLVNFTDLNVGRGMTADVMPGFTIGLRF